MTTYSPRAKLRGELPGFGAGPMPDHCIAFWNVENLLDVEGASLDRRPDKGRRALRVGTAISEVKGWDQAALDRQTGRLALVITQMNGGGARTSSGCARWRTATCWTCWPPRWRPRAAATRWCTPTRRTPRHRRGFPVRPDRLRGGGGRRVLELHRQAHRHARPAADVLPGHPRPAACVHRQPLAVPLGGRFEGEPFHIIADETLAYFHERITEIHGKDVAMLTMGDFNDEPQDRSLAEHARSYRTRANVARATSPALLNLMQPAGAAPKGTHFHGNQPGVLDQFPVSKGPLTGKSGFAVQAEATAVLNLPVMAKGVCPRSPVVMADPPARQVTMRTASATTIRS